MNIPILFIAYKRYDYVEKTFNKILEHNPDKIYISIDGSKNNIDIIDVDKTINIIKKLLIEYKINDDKVKFLTSDINLGCEVNILKSINWVFSIEEDLIIIEEDVLINDNFIEFILNNKKKYIDENYCCISKVLYNSFINDNYQFNSHGWYINKYNWVNTFKIQHIVEDNELFEKIIQEVYQPSPDAYKAMKYTLQQRHFHWDENFKYNIYLQNKKILYLSSDSTEHIGRISTNKDDKYTLDKMNNLIKL